MSGSHNIARGAFVAALVLAALPAQALAQGYYGPFGQPQEDYGAGVTVVGGGLARVKAPADLSEESVQKAIDAARPRAVARALAEARRRAEAVATAAGISLGSTRAIELNPGFQGREPCRRSRRTQEVRCVAPAFTGASATVTFEISGGASSTEGVRELSASATGTAPVQPARQTSPSIRRALVSAHRLATPKAARAAHDGLELAAQGSGLTLGAPFSIVEQVSPYGPDTLLGAFAPGRFCGTIRRAIVRRDPDTGQHRVVGRRRVRRCFVPPTSQVTLTATYLAQGG
jgi:hypothetical protein